MQFCIDGHFKLQGDTSPNFYRSARTRNLKVVEISWRTIEIYSFIPSSTTHSIIKPHSSQVSRSSIYIRRIRMCPIYFFLLRKEDREFLAKKVNYLYLDHLLFSTTYYNSVQFTFRTNKLKKIDNAFINING